MYDIRQFRPALYFLLVLGVTGFALAAQSPVVWVGAVSAMLLNAWLVKTGRFHAMPRLVANGITVIATIYSFIAFNHSSTAILVIGEYLVFLQVVKLFEQRGNRDYAQLLVLSLLLMVAASINTSSLIFGLLLIIYLFLSLYCCLLFHLKVETDHAKSVIGLPDDKLNPMTLRQDQRYLAGSMRKLTVLVSIAAISMAVVVFLFFPRSTGAGLLGPLAPKTAESLSGFSDKVDFQQVAKITQNAEVIAYVKLLHNGKLVEGTMPLLLRGVSLDVYTGNDPNASPWQWTRQPGVQVPFDFSQPERADHQVFFNSSGTAVGEWTQSVTLLPTGSACLFALPGVVSFTPGSQMVGKLSFEQRDQSIASDSPIDRRIHYDVTSSGRMINAPLTADAGAALLAVSDKSSDKSNDSDAGNGKVNRIDVQPTHSRIDPKIEAMARRPEVSGVDASGALATQRKKDAYVSPLDQQIASNIENYLQSTGGFTYTLDLTDAKGIGDRDPMVAFLYDLKRGHCEYFAGAMTLMCQSLGMQARVVVGFKVDGADYNSMTASYVVRQSHAHAWVEVLNDKGEWITFDPTTGAEAKQSSAMTLWKRAMQIFDYLDYTWANHVVAYDSESRSSLMQKVENKLDDSASTGSDRLQKIKSFLTNLFSLQNYYKFSTNLLALIITLLSIAMVGSVLWFLLERWKIRRRARRIGLDALPPGAQLRMARQLGFYDDLIRLLARHEIECPPNMTPLEFSRSISFLPNEMFDAIHRLTEIFYEVRFGRAKLSGAQQRHLNNVIAKVESGLGNVNVKRI